MEWGVCRDVVVLSFIFAESVLLKFNDDESLPKDPKPDADGFINISWPSRTIPHGGIFHTRVVQPSENQQKFLKVLLEESKLTIAQRAKSTWKLREDEPQERERRGPPRVQMPMVRPRTSHRRSLSAIRESGVYEADPYRPLKRGEDRELLKEKLAKLMAFGDNSEEQIEQKPLASGIVKPMPKLPTGKEMRNELLTQIRERVEWLAEMEYLGQAAPHREIIQDQIAERMRSLDALGIESECSSARSTATGFSTLRSREKVPRDEKSGRSKGSATKPDIRFTKFQEKRRSTQSSARGRVQKEENVIAYNNLSPLEYSPRRRV